MKIKEKIDEIAKNKKIGLMGHIIAGFPNIETSYLAAIAVGGGGVDLLEVQFPFSDPTADGPTIEGACYEALSNGFKIADGFELVKRVTTTLTIPILIMTYSNIVFKYGVEKFVKKSKESGVSGLIVPDLPLENDEGLNKYCQNYGIDNIFVVAPGCSKDRIKKLSQNGSAFLYTVARRGITGKKTEIDSSVTEWLKLVKENSVLPIATGFGIQSKAQIDELITKSDIAVVGSYFVNAIKDAFQKGLDIKTTLSNSTKNLIG